MRRALFILLLFITLGCKKATVAVIETEYGDMEVELYDTTPLHKENFIKLVNEKFYDGLLFHRIIRGFMVQGGDPTSRNAQPKQLLGMGGPGYEINSEIGSPHFKGCLAAAQMENVKGTTSGSQFFLVHGRKVEDSFIDMIEQKKNIKYNETQKKRYKEQGGMPELDLRYTVFGEIVDGIEVLDKIAEEETDGNDRPIKDIKMKIRIK
jgi:peptidyl-prolyl cis-trans isomerase B (cyclophilin B)